MSKGHQCHSPLHCPNKKSVPIIGFFFSVGKQMYFCLSFCFICVCILNCSLVSFGKEKKKKVNQGTPVHSKLTQYFWGFFIGIIPSGHPRQCRTVCLQHHSSITGWKFLQCSYRTVVQAVNRQEET